MKRIWQILAMTAAALLLAGCAAGMGNQALQSCLDQARRECSATATESCLAAAEISCGKLTPQTESQNGNGGGGY